VKFRVVSWNIELGRNLDQAADELRTIEPLADADIVLLQEMDDEGTAFLAGELAMDHHYDSPAPHPLTGKPFGNAILSRWPLLEAAEVRFPHRARVQGQLRGATKAVVDLQGTHVTGYSVHIETVLMGTRRRSAQVRTLGSDAGRTPAPHMVIGGDFNAATARSRRAFDAALGEAGLLRATNDERGTFERFGRSFALDHIYTRGLRVLASGVAAEPGASDHQPVWAELEAP
jgi:endonuclease/exonuclease/phosphatase family metal-dependent hydrolase